jgi:hypothetical protein
MGAENKALVLFHEVLASETLTVYDDKAQIKMDILLSGLISPYNSAMSDEIEEVVLKMYYDAVEKDGEIPDMEIIMMMINNYNWNIFHKIAEIDFYTNYYEQVIQENGRDTVDGEFIEKYIASLADQHWEGRYYDMLDENPEFVMEILDSNNLCYEYSRQDEFYTYFSRSYNDILIVKNDAQNLMFPEIHLEQMNFALQDLTEDEVLNTMIFNK